MNKTRKVARAVSSFGGKAICAVAALISLAVLLGFASRRSELLDSSLAPRELALGGVALLLLAVLVLALEARRDRRVKGAIAVLSVLCAAGGAVLVWVAFDEGQSGGGRDKGPIAKVDHGHGKGWRVGKGHAPKPKGGAKSRAGKDAGAGAAGGGATDAAGEEGGYGEEGEAGTSTAPEPDCYCKGEPYEYESGGGGGGGGGGGYYGNESGGGAYDYEYEYEAEEEPEPEYEPEEEPEDELGWGSEYEEEGGEW